jgi:hypothetical protein
LLKRIAAAWSWLWRGIDPAGLGMQIVLTLGALGSAGWMITQLGAPRWIAPIAFIIGNGLGAYIHARWAVAERSLARRVANTLLLRAEGVTLLLCAILIEGVRALPLTLTPELVTAVSSARLAFGVAAGYIVTHALVNAPHWLANRTLADDSDARIRVPRRPPRMRLRSPSGPPDA